MLSEIQIMICLKPGFKAILRLYSTELCPGFGIRISYTKNWSCLHSDFGLGQISSIWISAFHSTFSADEKKKVVEMKIVEKIFKGINQDKKLWRCNQLRLKLIVIKLTFNQVFRSKFKVGL